MRDILVLLLSAGHLYCHVRITRRCSHHCLMHRLHGCFRCAVPVRANVSVEHTAVSYAARLHHVLLRAPAKRLRRLVWNRVRYHSVPVCWLGQINTPCVLLP